MATETQVLRTEKLKCHSDGGGALRVPVPLPGFFFSDRRFWAWLEPKPRLGQGHDLDGLSARLVRAGSSLGPGLLLARRDGILAGRNRITHQRMVRVSWA